MSLDENLDNESYKIKDELQIRKILEARTEWEMEFTKNGKYKYDMKLYRWNEEPNSPDDREIFGFIELERARKDGWLTGDIPDNWVYYTFLERKVSEYDHNLGRWEGPKDDYRRTVYLKFSHVLDNCFVAPIASIYRDGSVTSRSTGTYTNTYRSLPFNHPDTRIGIDDCIAFTEEYLEQIDGKQTGLEKFSGVSETVKYSGGHPVRSDL